MRRIRTLSIRPKIPEIQYEESNKPQIFRKETPEICVYLARLSNNDPENRNCLENSVPFGHSHSHSAPKFFETSNTNVWPNGKRKKRKMVPYKLNTTNTIVKLLSGG